MCVGASVREEKSAERERECRERERVIEREREREREREKVNSKGCSFSKMTFSWAHLIHDD